MRDKQYGVPRIYGDTRATSMFGAGYAGAQDRLFLMDILRHTGRASSPRSPAAPPATARWTARSGRSRRTRRPTSRSRSTSRPRVYGDAGQQLVSDVDEFVAGINAYIDEALLDPTKLPAEYAAFGKTPTHWTGTDVIAEASLSAASSARAAATRSARRDVLHALEKRFGRRAGPQRVGGLPLQERPRGADDRPASASRTRPRSPFAKRGLALPGPGLGRAGRVRRRRSTAKRGAPATPDRRAAQARRSTSPATRRTGRWSARASRQPGTRSACSGRRSATTCPQILMEEELHGPGFDARGAAFPGVNLMVQLGHGRDYAWSATTATSDNIDTFAEVLCEDDFHYRYKGECLAMEKLERTNSWTPNAVDDTPPGRETLTAYRTVHGIVYARGTVKGKKVAFARARTTYFHEADSAIGFFQLNDPNFVKGPQSFRQAIDGINFLFNWAYIDANDIAYQLSGAHPVKAKGTSPDFPVLGTGEYDWQGYDPDIHTIEDGAAQRTAARGQPALPRLVEQQAGAGLRGRGRQVHLRAGLPLADDRAAREARDQGAAEDAPRAARPGDGGAGDARTSAASSSCRSWPRRWAR